MDPALKIGMQSIQHCLFSNWARHLASIRSAMWNWHDFSLQLRTLTVKILGRINCIVEVFSLIRCFPIVCLVAGIHTILFEFGYGISNGNRNFKLRNNSSIRGLLWFCHYNRPGRLGKIEGLQGKIEGLRDKDKRLQSFLSTWGI